MKYYNSKIVNLTFDEAVTKVSAELAREGFGILTEINIKETLKKKLDVDFRNYKILGACNPPFAYKALTTEENIGVLLPCNIAVQEKEIGQTSVSIVNPMVSMQNVENENLGLIATEISAKLQRVLERV